MNNIYSRLLQYIGEERSAFNTLVDTDDILGLNVTPREIIEFLEFSISSQLLPSPIVGKIIITEGDTLSILKIINDISRYNGEYILYINGDNAGTNTYLVSRANMIYEEFNLKVKINIDYSDNYNKYLNELVSIVGSDNFVSTASKDFDKANRITV